MTERKTERSDDVETIDRYLHLRILKAMKRKKFYLFPFMVKNHWKEEVAIDVCSVN